MTTKLKIVVEVDEKQTIKDHQLLSVVRNEVEAFTKSMHTIGVKCDFEIVEETIKTF